MRSGPCSSSGVGPATRADSARREHMNPSAAAADRPDTGTTLERFEEAWRRGPPPRLTDFLPPDFSRRLVEELVTVDLEYRWRSGLQARLEEYVAQHTALQPLQRLPIELITYEYRVRHCWGDKPNHAEYVSRFPQHGPALLAALRSTDAELTAEFGQGNLQERTAADAVLPPAPEKPVILSAAALVEALRRHRLLSPGQLDTLDRELLQRISEARALAGALLQRGWLTAYQVNQLLLGRGGELQIGPYVLLERLGEGGAGQVFKARHQRLQRPVALKVIRKELLTDAEVVARFYREIQVISQLDHPNIVHAYDAGPIGTAHVLVMEYVTGADLAHLVRNSGPLPVDQACEFIRQAALGL